MKYLLPLILLVGCAAPRRSPIQGDIRESHGVYVYSMTYHDASDFCYTLVGERSDGCWVPELKLAVQSIPTKLSKDICLASSDPVECVKDLF